MAWVCCNREFPNLSSSLTQISRNSGHTCQPLQLPNRSKIVYKARQYYDCVHCMMISRLGNSFASLTLLSGIHSLTRNASFNVFFVVLQKKNIAVVGDSNSFSWLEICAFGMKRHWNLFQRIPLTLTQYQYKHGWVITPQTVMWTELLIHRHM